MPVTDQSFIPPFPDLSLELLPPLCSAVRVFACCLAEIQSNYQRKPAPTALIHLNWSKKIDAPFSQVHGRLNSRSLGCRHEILAPLSPLPDHSVSFTSPFTSIKEKSDYAFAAFNSHVTRDRRVDQVLLSVRDGVMLVRKK